MEEKNSDMLLEKGEGFRKWGFRIFLVGAALLVITIFIISSKSSRYSDLEKILDSIIWVVLSVSFLSTGFNLYFKGLHLIGLGQIAQNTDNIDQIVENTVKEQESEEENN